nr:hypothetical protein [Tanacetum cinerariifolium]
KQFLRRQDEAYDLQQSYKFIEFGWRTVRVLQVININHRFWRADSKSMSELELQVPSSSVGLLEGVGPSVGNNTLTYEAKTGAYSFQQDETRFVLDANFLREALETTPIDQAYQFVSPPLGKTSRYDRPRYQVLHMLWGIITSTNVDYAELMWEEFVEVIQTFLTDKGNLGNPTKKGREDKPYVILYYRFTKLIIYHLGRTHNIHQRLASPFHLADEDLRLGNLKFIPKGEEDEVFRMPIPNELISNNIINA